MSHDNKEVSKAGSGTRWSSQVLDLFHREFVVPSSVNGSTQSSDMNSESTVLYNPGCNPPRSAFMVFLLFLVTTLAKVLNDWAETHFLSGTKGQPYFFKLWARSLVIVICLQFVLKNLSSSLNSRMRTAKSKIFLLWPLMTLHLVTVLAFSFNFLKSTKNAAGSEFYQVNIVLNLLALAAGLHISSRMNIPNHVHVALIVISGLQLMILAQDDYFHMPFTASLYTLAVAASNGCYVLLLFSNLRKESILELIYYLNLFLVMSLPFVVLVSDTFPELNEKTLSLNSISSGVFRIVLMASLMLFNMVASFLFMKTINPLACVVSWNLGWVIHTLIMAFVYKLIYHVSSFKIAWFMIVHVFLVFGPFFQDSSSAG